jgi:hypothetical protein
MNNLRSNKDEPRRIVVLHPFPTSWEFIVDANELGFEVWTTSTEGLHLPERVSSKIRRVLNNSVYEAEAIAAEIGTDTNVALFYPGSEMAVLSAAKLSELFHLPGNPPEAALSSRYKDVMRLAFQKITPENNPRFAIIKERLDLKKAASQVGFPAVFKRTDFAGSYGVKLVRNIKELEEYYNEQSALTKLPYGQAIRHVYLLEEYISGQEFSVESVTIGGVTTVLGVTKKTTGPEPYFIEVKHEFPAQFFGVPIEQVNELKRLAKQVTEGLGFKFCVSHFEARWDKKDNRPKIMEVASRTGGDYIPVLLKQTTGHYTWYPLLHYLLGSSEYGNGSQLNISGGASVQFLVAHQSGIMEGVDHLDEIRAHPAHVIDVITHDFDTPLIVNSSYTDRIGYFIGASNNIDELRTYQNLVSQARLLYRRIGEFNE